MKKILFALASILMAAMLLSSCEDSPAPEEEKFEKPGAGDLFLIVHANVKTLDWEDPELWTTSEGARSLKEGYSFESVETGGVTEIIISGVTVEFESSIKAKLRVAFSSDGEEHELLEEYDGWPSGMTGEMSWNFVSMQHDGVPVEDPFWRSMAYGNI